MKCSEVVKILECTSFTDNNFSDLDKNEELDNHIKNCEECEAKRDKIREYDLLLKARIKNVKVPINLKSTITENLQNYKKNKEVSNSKSLFSFNINKMFGLVASIILFVIVFVGLPRNNTSFEAIVSDAISSHNKNLSMDIICDENVKISNLENWIKEKVDFNISLEELGDYKIIGARECNLCEETVAYLFLEKDGVKYSMFIFDSDDFDKISFNSQSSIVDNHVIKFWQKKKYGYCLVNNV